MKYATLLCSRVLVSNFTEEQLNRYEMFRRAAFPRAAIKRVSGITLPSLNSAQPLLFIDRFASLSKFKI